MPRLLLERGISLNLRVSGRRGKVKAKNSVRVFMFMINRNLTTLFSPCGKYILLSVLIGGHHAMCVVRARWCDTIDVHTRGQDRNLRRRGRHGGVRRGDSSAPPQSNHGKRRRRGACSPGARGGKSGQVLFRALSVLIGVHHAMCVVRARWCDACDVHTRGQDGDLRGRGRQRGSSSATPIHSIFDPKLVLSSSI